MYKIKVLIADDHLLVRDGIVAILKTSQDIEVVAEASDGLEAIEKTVECKPDIVIMDVNMPKLGGYEAVIELRKLEPEVKILVLTQYDDSAYISRFLKAGVSGYLLKNAAGVELITALKAVKKGETYLHSSIASKVVSGYIGRDKQPQVQDPYENITDREKQVLKLLGEGYKHKEIADMLSISTKTVIAHQTNICEKLNIHSRIGLVKFALQKGIIKM